MESHRLKMILDDMRQIKAFIYENGLDKVFKKQTKHSDECWTHFNNIEIACDEENDECLNWKEFES